MTAVIRPIKNFLQVSFSESKSFVIKKSKQVSLFIVSFAFVHSVSQAQSGTALSFDGTDDNVLLPFTMIVSGSYTKEAWININAINGSLNIISGTTTAFWAPSGQLASGHNFAFVNQQDPVVMSLNTWYHVAVTYDEPTNFMTNLQNGILVASGNPADAGTPNYTETTLYIGDYDPGAGPGGFVFDGLIDEVRIWSTALTQAEIRDWMCKTVTASHPQYASLDAYYNCDEGSGTTLGDPINSNDGTLQNGTAWTTSGAPIGAESAHDYVNVTKTVNLAHPSAENLTATEASGTPDAIHVYRVDAVPNSTTGISGLGSNDRYFGVFQVGGTAPTYDVVYDYTGNPGIGGQNENDLLLFRRTDNSAVTWTDAGATLDAGANTLTALGESTEYIIGSSGFSLPVTLSHFTATKQRDGKVRLDWTTSTEINNSGFEIQRSKEGSVWTKIGFIQGAGNSTTERNYAYTDNLPAKGINYYRLKQIDIDNKFKFSEVKTVLFESQINLVYPVPTNDIVIIELKDSKLVGTIAVISDQLGRIVQKVPVSKMQQQVSLARLNAGIYFLKLEDGETYKLIKQ
ncbi:MAG: T9SS type A sorting domain-containing protein [Bacteroidia bacterium]|nr:T9SS type A sorting domain-containing protein [Bacteroidia bacterium]